MPKLKKHFLIVIFLIFYFTATIYKFIVYPTPFYDWDEAIYAQVGKEMIEKKSIVPLWQGKYWLDKPPLAPLIYGIVETIIPLNPELSTRIFTLILTIFLFSLIYYFYYKISKNEYIAFLTVVISSFTPIFLQRAQVLNVDIFLFIGWMGYLIFFNHFWLSLLFLSIGVLSKSLLGFYPVIIIEGIYIFQYLTKSLSIKEFLKKTKYLIIQSFVPLIWYIGMFIYFRYEFIQAHFFDSHLKRVTASIESHFGKRTFYLDTLAQQLGIFFYLSIISLLILIFRTLQKFFSPQKNQFSILYPLFSVFFVPWFAFLNLTKTKISWYLYPVIPQFAFLGVYFLKILRKKTKIMFLISIIITGVFIYHQFSTNKFFNDRYSQYDENYIIARSASDKCSTIHMLVDPDSRNTYHTLKKMNLVIGTSHWWGNHPSIVYYSNKKVNFVYDIDKFSQLIKNTLPKTCFIYYENDHGLFPHSHSLIKKEKNLYLYIASQ